MNGQRIKQMPAAYRPRERLLEVGPGALALRELLAILFRTGSKGRSALDLADDLLKDHPNIGALTRCSLGDLVRIRGIGKTKAVQLAAALELAARAGREAVGDRERMDAPDLVVAYLGPRLRAERVEVLKVLLLDTRLRLIHEVEISRGTINESVAHPREIFREAILRSAYAVIVVHNHPSGDPAPSTADTRITRRLAEVAVLHEIKLIDHIIIGAPSENGPGYFSFREAGLL